MTILRTTCTECTEAHDLRADSTVLELPGPDADRELEPQLVHACPSCSAARVSTVSWRLAAYLVQAGATSVVCPDEEQLRPTYPEQRPFTSGPMTLDDLIALHAALDAPAAFL